MELVQDLLETSINTNININTLTDKSILFCANGIVNNVATCVRVTSDRIIKDHLPGKKMVMEVIFQGKRALAKCWSKEYYESYFAESCFYEALVDRKLQTPEFPSFLAYGEIVCLSLFPSGGTLIISWVPRDTVLSLWPSLTRDERLHIRKQCQEAVIILRKLDIYLQDVGRHNVLYDRESGRVTRVGFEHYGHCTPMHLRSLDAPELIAIVNESDL